MNGCDSDSTIDDMIDSGKSEVAIAILVLAREIESSRMAWSDFVGRGVGGRLDEYLAHAEKSFADAISPLADAISRLADRDGVGPIAIPAPHEYPVGDQEI